MDDIQDADKSAYNSAVQFMFELATIRRQLHQARWEANLELRYDILVSYYMALSARMKKELQSKHDDMYHNASQALSAYLGAKRRNRRIPSGVYALLDNWERELRKDENALGLLVPDKSDPAFALGGQTF